MIYILLACFAWALDAPFRYPLVQAGVSSFFLVAFEHLLLVLILAPLWYPLVKRIPKLSLGQIWSFFVIGAIGSVGATVCFSEAFSLLNPSVVILLQKLQPLWAVLLARVILKEQVHRTFLLWSLLALISATVLSLPKEVFTTGEIIAGGEWLSLGVVYTLLSVIGWGSSTVYGRKLLIDSFSVNEVWGGRFLVGTLALLPFLNFAQSSIEVSRIYLFELVAMSVLAGVVGMGLYYVGLKRTEAKLATIAELFFPLTAVLVNWVWLGQSLEIHQIVGGIGVTVASYQITKHN